MTSITNEVRRGDIWWADLGHTDGSEQGGVRPIVVVQNNAGNKFAPTVVCAPITSKMKRRLPTHVDIARGQCGLACDSTVLTEQIKTIDKSKLQRKMGSINMTNVDKAILISVGIDLRNFIS